MNSSEDKKLPSLSISKADLAKLPAAEYSGDIFLVDAPEKVEAAVDILKRADVIGFDTETRPSFKRGQSFQVALLQLATRSQCFLFRLNLIGLPDSVKLILEDENILKIGVSLHDDFHNLNKIFSLNPAGFIDLQPFVKDYGIADNSLSRIYGIIFGHRISKSQRLTNWEASKLTPAQQSYASLDAKSCITIYEHLKAGLFNPYESQYIIPPAEEENPE